VCLVCECFIFWLNSTNKQTNTQTNKLPLEPQTETSDTSAKTLYEVGENGMSSGWICRLHQNVGEFVPFLLEVGEYDVEVDKFVNFAYLLGTTWKMTDSPTLFLYFTHSVPSGPFITNHNIPIHPFPNGLFL